MAIKAKAVVEVLQFMDGFAEVLAMDPVEVYWWLEWMKIAQLPEFLALLEASAIASGNWPTIIDRHMCSFSAHWAHWW